MSAIYSHTFRTYDATIQHNYQNTASRLTFPDGTTREYVSAAGEQPSATLQAMQAARAALRQRLDDEERAKAEKRRELIAEAAGRTTKAAEHPEPASDG